MKYVQPEVPTLAAAETAAFQPVSFETLATPGLKEARRRPGSKSGSMKQKVDSCSALTPSMAPELVHAAILDTSHAHKEDRWMRSATFMDAVNSIPAANLSLAAGKETSATVDDVERINLAMAQSRPLPDWAIVSTEDAVDSAKGFRADFPPSAPVSALKLTDAELPGQATCSGGFRPIGDIIKGIMLGMPPARAIRRKGGGADPVTVPGHASTTHDDIVEYGPIEGPCRPGTGAAFAGSRMHGRCPMHRPRPLDEVNLFDLRVQIPRADGSDGAGAAVPPADDVCASGGAFVHVLYAVNARTHYGVALAVFPEGAPFDAGDFLDAVGGNRQWQADAAGCLYRWDPSGAVGSMVLFIEVHALTRAITEAAIARNIEVRIPGATDRSAPKRVWRLSKALHQAVVDHLEPGVLPDSKCVQDLQDRLVREIVDVHNNRAGPLSPWLLTRRNAGRGAGRGLADTGPSPLVDSQDLRSGPYPEARDRPSGRRTRRLN